MTITALPAAPSRSDPQATFIAKADAFLAALATFVSEANETANAMNLNSTTDTSSSSVLIGTGSKTFTVSAGKSFQIGMWLIIANTTTPGNYMYGQVTSYSGTTLIVNVASVGGSGTLAAWTISQSATGAITGNIVASLVSNLFTGAQNFARATVASAATTADIWGAAGNTINWTGTTTCTGFPAAPQAGASRKLIMASAGAAFTAGANMLIQGIPSGSTITLAANDIVTVEAISTTQFELSIQKYNNEIKSIFPISASVAANAMTLKLSPCVLDFRSSTIGSGAVNARAVPSEISTVISSGSTAGTTSATLSRIAILAIDNAGSVELAWCNADGFNLLDEAYLISTTAEGGAGAADSANTIYSTTARSNVPFRIVGIIESTQTTAGTWATAPSAIIGAGGLSATINAATKLVSTEVSLNTGTATVSLLSSVPSWVKRITIAISDVSTSGTSPYHLRLGDAGGVENTGYTGGLFSSTGASSAVSTFTAGFELVGSMTAATNHFISITLVRATKDGTGWHASWIAMRNDGNSANTGNGYKALSQPITQIQLTTLLGTPTMDNGTATIIME